MMRNHKAEPQPAQDSTLVYAAALSDHYTRQLQLGGKKRRPCQLPGSQLTLAQVVGIIPKPEQLLTPEQWAEIHGAAQRRGSLSDACTICMESFNAEQQVLLGCTHVFHAQCLASFERYCRMHATPLQCPLCRKPWYQKRLLGDPPEACQLIRGCSALTKTLTQLVQHSTVDVDNLEAELDASLAQCRQLMNPLHHRSTGDDPEAMPPSAAAPADTQVQLAHNCSAKNQVQKSPSSSQPVRGRQCSSRGSSSRTSKAIRPLIGGRAHFAGSRQTASERKADVAIPVCDAATTVVQQQEQQHPHLVSVEHSVAATVDWEDVIAQASSRGHTECAICLGPLAARRETAGVALLSCTHTFHLQCVLAFEEFRGGKSNNCPVCRATYSRRCFAVADMEVLAEHTD